MKRIIPLFLALAFVFSCASAVGAEAENGEPVKVKIQVYSNLNGQQGVAGLYYDNAFYVTPSVICSLANGSVSQSSKDRAVFSFFDGLMSITVDTDDETIPAITYNNKLYISAAHFLRYMGFGVSFADSEQAGIHMFVYREYTVMDALAEYINDSCRFSWSEADGIGDLTRVLSALDTALLGYDPNIFRYFPGMFGVDSVEKEMNIDVLKLILGSWNTEHLSGDDPMLAVLNASTDLSSIYFDAIGWYGYFEEAVGRNAISEIGVLNDALGITVFDAAGGVIGIAADQAKAVDLFKQFANMTELSKNMLTDSLGRIDRSSSFYKQRPELFKAVKDVRKMFDGSYKPNLLEDVFSNTWETVLSAVAGVPATAWSMIATLLQNNETVQTVVSKEMNVTYAGGCTNIEVIADSMVMETYRQLSGVKNPDSSLLEDTQKQLKAQMAMSLKASLTAREQLLETGWLKGGAPAEMERACRLNAEQLNRIINAQPLEIDSMPQVDEDLSWISLLTLGEIYGHVVEYNGDLYYWKYNGDSFSREGTSGYFSFRTSTKNQLVRRSADGSEAVILEASGRGQIAVVGKKIYYYDCEDQALHVYNTATKSNAALDCGSISAATEDGRYLISRFVSIDTTTDTLTLLVDSGTYLDYHDGVVYFSKSPDDSKLGQMGQVTVSRVLVDGTEQYDLCTTEPDLYGSDPTQFYGSSASVQEIYFDDEYIYFSYGQIAGTGLIYQGGKIIRMGYDGSNAEVVAGEDKLVGARFIVSADHEVTSYDNNGESMNAYGIYYDNSGSVYQYDAEEGEERILISQLDYAVLGAGIAGRYDIANYFVLDFVQHTGDMVYFFALHAQKDPDDFMMRPKAVLQNAALFAKNLTTGEVTILYSF